MARAPGTAGSNYDRLEDAVVQQLGQTDGDLDQTYDSAERRLSFRCPVPEDQGNAMLIRSRNNLPCPVRLMNQSAGGYSVSCQGNVRFRNQEVLQLRTQSGLFEVQVAHVKRENNTTHVGLVLLGEVRDVPEVRSLSLSTLFLIFIFTSAFFFFLSVRH